MIAATGARLIAGPPRSGKTTQLRQAAATARERGEHVLTLTAPDALTGVAFEILHGTGRAAREIDDIDAAALLESAARPLLELEPGLLDTTIDPEVGGMRSPSRFLGSAYRLFRKLREAAIGPEEFLARSLAGATNFYAKPPNFAHTELIMATKETYRDSLDVTPAELDRQRLREIDLAKILSTLYARYVQATREANRLTGRDAIAEAIATLHDDPRALERERAKQRRFFIDEAQELSGAEVALLQLLAGPELAGVTLAGDAASALRTHAASAGAQLLKRIADRLALPTSHGVPPASANAVAQLTATATLPYPEAAATFFVERFANEREEITGLVRRVRGWRNEGVSPSNIGVLFRSVCDVGAYERALLDADIPVAVSGDVNIFDDPRALDALALLWNAWDPFAHAWLLRTLEGPALALSDASLATLCSEPSDPQASLFADEDERAPTVRASRWDPKRDVRLGWNVIRGDQDSALGEDARERVRWFRATREAWVRDLAHAGITEAARRIWSDALAREGAPGSARERAQHVVLERLLHRLRAFEESRPHANLGDALRYAEERRTSEFESCEDDVEFGVQLRSIAASRGRCFERLALPDVKAGSFPRWYAPDTFLFSPTLGMIPKENAGGARAARTAKFTYYVHRVKARETFNEGERRALAYALTRSTGEVYLTTSGRPTRGISAPEFFEELKNARLPGLRA